MHETGHWERRRALILGVLGVAALGGRAFAQSKARVLAAASLQNLLSDAAAAFQRDGGGAVELSFGASSLLARQVAEGAPGDLFISADEEWMDDLARRGRIDTASRRDLYGNALVLIAPASSHLALTPSPGFPLLAALGEGRLALAGSSVPAGLYADAALRALGVYDAVKDRIARADNVRAALAYVARGEAPLGVVYATDARVEPGVRVVGVFPETSHPKILYPAALLRGASATARAFLAFLSSDKGRRLAHSYGFGDPH